MSLNFPQTEEETLRYWREIEAFQTQLRLTESCPKFTFYDGPPFATGLPHYGHLLASTVKDIIPRYWSMKGRHVIRRFGWDTHGLPIEYEIDKKHGISGRDAVMQMGIEKYNEECRAIVMKYASEWRQTIERLGRWIDFDNDYKTMDPSFMESVWWVFKQLYDRGQVYRSYQIMPYSTALCTPLSNFEAAQNYKDAQDPAIVVSFPIVDPPDADASLLIWTTTPWTLPSNIAISAHPDFEYIKIRDENSNQNFILLESGLSVLYKDPKKAKFKILDRFRGKDMEGWKYQPIFDYFADKFQDCFRVINATYVTADDGVGLVHNAPAFGQEDFDATTEAGMISQTRLPPNPVDEKGCFTSEVPDFAGLHVKDAEKPILKHLKASGRLIVDSQITHSVGFCWRSDTPLIRKAVSAWFVKVSESIPQMLSNIEDTNWVPSFVKEKRFANWISNAKDWNVSRNRYWGTPIPLWVSDDYEEVVCVGSIAELKELSGYEGDLTDIHRDKVDKITIPSKKGKGVLRRVEEVFDCWFESGSMPYASQHFPFKNPDSFHGSLFPADFISEGLDQTRGWFYTLLVLGTKLFGVSPFKNCIVSGIILAENGKKMSKRLKNYPDPSKIMDLYGSDALRLYLINSPVVRAEPLRFKEAEVKEVVTKVLLPLWNSYKFFSEQVALLKKTENISFTFDPTLRIAEDGNVMDRWILADCQSLLAFVEQEMAANDDRKAYRLYTVVPRLLRLIDNLTNWYIRFNRKRLKGIAGLGPKPIPFKRELFDENVERRVARMQKVIDLGRAARDKCGIGLKTPLRTLVVIADASYLEDVQSLESYVREELNVRNIIFTSDEDKYNVRLQAAVDWPTLGKKLKKDVQKVRKALPSLTNDQLRRFLQEKTITIDGIELGESDLTVNRALGDVKGTAGEKWEASSDNETIVLLDSTLYPELMDQGLARELINRVQRLRKKAGLVPTDDVRMEYRILNNEANVDIKGAIQQNDELIRNAIRGDLTESEAATADEQKLIMEETQEVNNVTLLLRLLRF
ncbi:Isoleucine--tRNA ligase [Rasamsonia emersonii CBS 393.64]|uniref:isoleucine--tRNA ligase n=1 Tax=Rasamsonia emersonii (strain ATCC 16479 / CBS 393.64 / IMI 116815) TaxID=1408163 RepID=A0A0F4YRC0_RASE3|nr:Isoleucine--tRNA ligase [Rasamsonia emersonii CBS 393.64]KKA20158.1 Isoleucine--tRNA ligase [Rasamsonia emersonii CBS 393.64]